MLFGIKREEAREMLKSGKKNLINKGWIQKNYETDGQYCALGAAIAPQVTDPLDISGNYLSFHVAYALALSIHDDFDMRLSEESLRGCHRQEVISERFVEAVAGWNDQKERKKEDVIEVYDKALANFDDLYDQADAIRNDYFL